MRLSTEKNKKKKLLTVRVGLFSLREKAPTKNYVRERGIHTKMRFQTARTEKAILSDNRLYHCAVITSLLKLIRIFVDFLNLIIVQLGFLRTVPMGRY